MGAYHKYHDYSFTKPVVNNIPTKWFKVVNLVNDNVEMSKKEILDAVWPNRNSPYCVDDRGYMSAMFADFSRAKILVYDRVTHKWHVGPNGYNIINNYAA